jgi:hypothetical protein
VDYVDILNSSCGDTTRSWGSKRFPTYEMGNSGHPRKIAKTVINIHPRIQVAF